VSFHSFPSVDSYIRSSLTNLVINEEDSVAYEQSQPRRRTRPLTAVPSTRLTSSQHVETTLEQRNDGTRPQGAIVATSPRLNSSLSPIRHLSLLEPFNDSTPAGASPKRQARSILHTITSSHQHVEGEVYPNRPTFVSARPLIHSSLNYLVAMLSHPVQPGCLLR